MLPDLASMLDPSAFAIVVGGTALATLARAGTTDCALAAKACVNLSNDGFDEHANRTALARWVSAVKERGVLVADAPMPPDPALATSLSALIRSGTLAAMEQSFNASKAPRLSKSESAANVFEQAGDLAPVFGLVGTLFAVSQLGPNPGGDAVAESFGAIAAAVLSTLYGVLSAHLVFLPLGQAISRKSEREEAQREHLLKWLSSEVAPVLPSAEQTVRLHNVA